MIEGPLTGASSGDAVSSEDMTALTATVSTNTSAITLKAPIADLTLAEVSIATHSGEIGGLQNSFNNIGNSFYTKPLTDGFLSASKM